MGGLCCFILFRISLTIEVDVMLLKNKLMGPMRFPGTPSHKVMEPDNRIIIK